MIDPAQIEYCPCGRPIQGDHPTCKGCFLSSPFYWRNMLSKPDSTDIQRQRALNQILNHAAKRGRK